MKKMLIITSVNDLSIPLFLTQNIQKNIDVDFYFFYEGVDDLKKKMLSNEYNYIYIGYAFREIAGDILEDLFSAVLDCAKNAYIIDGLQDIEDLYFEDKWKQYQIFSEFMPETALLKDITDADKSEHITKERISGRAEGVYFNSENLDKDSLEKYIYQKMIDVEKEYRIYVICDEIIDTATIKSPKTLNSKVKVIGTEKISPAIKKFVEKIIKKNTFDFIGLDIAKAENDLFLIEVNRACLFNAHFKYTGVNLAETLIDKITQKY